MRFNLLTSFVVVAMVQQRPHLDHRPLRVAPAAVGILLRWKVGFEDRFQHQHRCCHVDPIAQGRDAQRPLAFGTNTLLMGSGR
jgi:hypothetical protein